MERRRAHRVAALIGIAVVAGISGCSSEPERPPSHLADGTRAKTLPVPLDAPGPWILTNVVSIAAKDVVAGTPAGACLRSAREHGATGPVVVRVGVSGVTATFRTASGRALVACDGSQATRRDGSSWCGRSLGRLESGRLPDPRLDLAGCRTPGGDTIAFAWFTPGPRTSYVAVRHDGYTEVYPVAGRLPVRVTTADIAADRSGATFEVSEHSADGVMLRSSTVDARVAG